MDVISLERLDAVIARKRAKAAQRDTDLAARNQPLALVNRAFAVLWVSLLVTAGVAALMGYSMVN